MTVLTFEELLKLLILCMNVCVDNKITYMYLVRFDVDNVVLTFHLDNGNNYTICKEEFTNSNLSCYVAARCYKFQELIPGNNILWQGEMKDLIKPDVNGKLKDKYLIFNPNDITSLKQTHATKLMSTD